MENKLNDNIQIKKCPHKNAKIIHFNKNLLKLFFQNEIDSLIEMFIKLKI
jgi:hypothetical protein